MEQLITLTLKQFNLKWTCNVQTLQENVSTRTLGNCQCPSFDSCAWNLLLGSAVPAAQFCLITSEEKGFICFSPVLLAKYVSKLFLLSRGSRYPFFCCCTSDDFAGSFLLFFRQYLWWHYGEQHPPGNWKKSKKYSKILCSSTELAGSQLASSSVDAVPIKYSE